MYQLLVAFTVRPEHDADFIRAAQKTAHDSVVDEPGTQRIEVIRDEQNPNLFYLNEVYADVAAFDAHAGGRHFAAFFEEARAWATGPAW
jgi:(4S)-4-hydroxy-5-phosphonooxypentane-2,3-dione isomerase